MNDDLHAVRTTLGRARDGLLGRKGVVGVGAGYKITGGVRTDILSVVCSVVEKVPLQDLSPNDRVPADLDGVATDVIATGAIRAFQSRTDRHRPAPGGVSIAHREVTAGTLGCLLRRGDELVILSNNHVLANSNGAAPGDPILQPGPHDDGTFPDDHIADLEDFVPIDFLAPEPPSDCSLAAAVSSALNAGCALIGSKTRYRTVRIQPVENQVDAAIARPLEPSLVQDEILEIGAPTGVGSGELGMAIRKSGRTTGLTSGEIVQVDVTVDVQYGGDRVARFADQLMAGAMSQGGDSGSAVVDSENRVVGLLFAGSESSTIINRIEHVAAALNLTR